MINLVDSVAIRKSPCSLVYVLVLEHTTFDLESVSAAKAKESVTIVVSYSQSLHTDHMFMSIIAHPHLYMEVTHHYFHIIPRCCLYNIIQQIVRHPCIAPIGEYACITVKLIDLVFMSAVNNPVIYWFPSDNQLGSFLVKHQSNSSFMCISAGIKDCDII